MSSQPEFRDGRWHATDDAGRELWFDSERQVWVADEDSAPVVIGTPQPPPPMASASIPPKDKGGPPAGFIGAVPTPPQRASASIPARIKASPPSGTFRGELLRGWERFWRLRWRIKGPVLAVIGFVGLSLISAPFGESDSNIPASQAITGPTDESGTLLAGAPVQETPKNSPTATNPSKPTNTPKATNTPKPTATPTATATPLPTKDGADYIDPRLLAADPKAYKGRNVQIQGGAQNIDQKSDYTWINFSAGVRGRDISEAIVVEVRPKNPNILSQECYRVYGIVEGTQKVRIVLTGAEKDVLFVKAYQIEDAPRGEFGFGCAAP